MLGGRYSSVGLRLNNLRINPVQLLSQLQDDLDSCRELLACSSLSKFNSVGLRLVDIKSEPLIDNV